MNTEELCLIDSVKKWNCSGSLEKLVCKYKPMIESLYQSYNINGFDKDDWYQEAFIVCHQTCISFNGDNGSKFGSFFKLKFKHHIIDMIRKENANKRVANQGTSSYDMLTEDNIPSPVIRVSHEESRGFTPQFEKALEKLSDVELISFNYLLGDIAFEDACKKARCTEDQMHRAINRCQIKLKNMIFDNK
ncbi:sigma-70 family RNA polymerase sigma factor [Lactobacillus terrae]|uniref:sigma-70 family RNA polymerase sigma factor n=1 Tax=Lactobacillus terrae TaxID=2269374 RepID=UPI000C1B6F89|nr:sigma-70 family RNA polymerase sigma factor [Lactobacillus terrae]